LTQTEEKPLSTTSTIYWISKTCLQDETFWFQIILLRGFCILMSTPINNLPTSYNLYTSHI